MTKKSVADLKTDISRDLASTPENITPTKLSTLLTDVVDSYPAPGGAAVSDAHITGLIDTALGTGGSSTVTAVNTLITTALGVHDTAHDPQILTAVAGELAKPGAAITTAVDGLIASQERFQGVAVEATPSVGGKEVLYSALPAPTTNPGHYWLAGVTNTPGTGPLSGKAINAGDMIMSDGAAYSVIKTGGSGMVPLTRAVGDTVYAPLMKAQAGAAPANAAADKTAPTGGNPLDIVIGEYHVWVKTPGGTWKKLLLDSPFGT